MRQDMLKLRASVHEVDFAIARIMRSLTKSGLLENTIVIFTTDHGICFPRSKCSLYDAGLETALLMRWPKRLAQNRVTNELLSNVDLMPTLLDLCDVPHPPGIQGRSFAGLLTGGTYQPRSEIFGEMTWHVTYNPMRCIRTDRYKLIHYYDPQPWTAMPQDFWKHCVAAPSLRAQFDFRPPEYEMFDLACDPYEQFNLIEARGGLQGLEDIRKQLQERLEQWMRDTNDPLLQGPVSQRSAAEGREAKVSPFYLFFATSFAPTASPPWGIRTSKPRNWTGWLATESFSAKRSPSLAGLRVLSAEDIVVHGKIRPPARLR